MEKEHNIEKVYDLIEKFDFSELSENGKSFVLEVISLQEYNNIRSIIADTKILFSKYPAPGKTGKLSSLKKLFNYPVKFYKVAAAVLIIIGSGFLFIKMKTSGQQDLIAIVDTVFVKKTDTLIIEKTDTIKLIKERIVNINTPEEKISISVNAEKTENIKYSSDCITELCPNDIEKIGDLQSKNDISKDNNLRDFIVTLN